MATAQPQRCVPNTVRESHWSTTVAVTKALQAIWNMRGCAPAVLRQCRVLRWRPRSRRRNPAIPIRCAMPSCLYSVRP